MRHALEYHSRKIDRPYINLKRDKIIGSSKAISDCLDQMALCAGADIGVLIYGETGTGKELFARAIHHNSKRSDKPFVIVDCASLPESLIESILFGHVKGSFSGAVTDQKGLIEQADGGTLFLDEVSELPLESQKRFLRILQEKTFRPIGKSQEQKSNFRLIAAVNKDLQQLVKLGKFRDDLYYRLNEFSFSIPPLRERKEDIEKLIINFVFKVCSDNLLPVKAILPETFELLKNNDWPGNVRQLEHVINKAVLSDPINPILYQIHFPHDIRIHHIHSQNRPPLELKNHFPPSSLVASNDILVQKESHPELPRHKEFRRSCCADIDQYYFKRLIKESKANIATACKISGLSSSRLYELYKINSIEIK